MLRRFFVILLTVVTILAAGWLALRRSDIPFETLESAYASVESEFVSLAPGLNVHYRDQGPEDAPAIVLVHGFAASLHTWEPWARRLKEEYRIVSLDLPGHGLTRGGADAVSIPGFVKVVDGVADAAGLERFTLVGSSMGGATAWAYALEHGDRLDGLVLVGASGWPRPAGETQPLAFRLLGNPLARRLLKDLDLSGLVRSGLEDSFADPRFVTDEMVARYAALSRAPGHREALLKMTSGESGRIEATAELMAQIEAPTLVIHGALDQLVPVDGGARFAETIPSAELMRLEGVGHLPHEEAADETAQRLRRFLETRIEAGGPARTAARRTVSQDGDAPLSR